MMKLTYFNGRGRAELARLVFAQAGVEYEDIRLDGGVAGEEWQALKATGKLPFLQLPILEASGEVLAQGRAIANYVARENGLGGANNLEKAKMDMIMDAIEDIFKSMTKYIMEKDETKKAEFKKEAETNTTPNILKCLEKILVANNGGDGYFVGNSVTVADLCFFDLASNIKIHLPDAKGMEDCPKLEALAKRVGALPKVAEWVKKRPETPF